MDIMLLGWALSIVLIVGLFLVNLKKKLDADKKVVPTETEIVEAAQDTTKEIAQAKQEVQHVIENDPQLIELLKTIQTVINDPTVDDAATIETIKNAMELMRM